MKVQDIKLEQMHSKLKHKHYYRVIVHACRHAINICTCVMRMIYSLGILYKLCKYFIHIKK